jgi:hypothetical protein
MILHSVRPSMTNRTEPLYVEAVLFPVAKIMMALNFMSCATTFMALRRFNNQPDLNCPAYGLPCVLFGIRHRVGSFLDPIGNFLFWGINPLLSSLLPELFALFFRPIFAANSLFSFHMKKIILAPIGDIVTKMFSIGLSPLSLSFSHGSIVYGKAQ